MSTFLQALRDLALLLGRIGLGAILIAHGYRRWQVSGIASQTAYLQQFSTPYPEVAAWGGTILELAGGLFLVVGALTPLVALAVVAEQALIVCYTSWYRGPYLLDEQGRHVGGYEYTVALGLLALLFMVFGAGRVSIDRLFRRSPGDSDAGYDERSPA